MWASQRESRKLESEAKRRRICQSCGREFIMPYPSGKANRGEIKAGLYCSRKCRGDAMTKASHKSSPSLKKKEPKHCKICGKEIVNRLVYCSDSCRKEKARRQSFESNKNKKLLKQRSCFECGTVFIPTYGDKRRNYCSDICLHKSMKRIRRQKERARLRLARVETVIAAKVFSRDGWRCQLCGKKLNQKHKGSYRDDAPELDHIIPLSKGGEHSYTNTQCACRKCNIEKNNKEYGQLRLFG